MDRKVVIMDHPLIQHKLSILRDVDTSTMEFRELVNEIAMLMMYDATRDLPLEDKQVTTPCGVADCKVLAGRKLAFVPILRAGLGMVDGALRLVPAARVGHIGLYRNEETLEPVEYYCKLPGDIGQRDVFVLDPMLATGGSAIDAIGQIKKRHPPQCKVPVHYRCAGGSGGPEEGASRCGYFLRRYGRSSERERLHCSRFGRCRRPYLRHQIRSDLLKRREFNFYVKK